MPIPGLVEYAALQRLLGADLERRVAAIEAQLRGDGSSRAAPLAERNAERQTDGAHLRAAIAAVLSDQPRATGKHVLRALDRQGWEPLPSERTARWHMQQIRGNGNT